MRYIVSLVCEIVSFGLEAQLQLDLIVVLVNSAGECDNGLTMPTRAVESMCDSSSSDTNKLDNSGSVSQTLSRVLGGLARLSTFFSRVR